MNHVNQSNSNNDRIDTRNDSMDAEGDGPSTSWLFSMESLDNTPSRRADISERDENAKRTESIFMILDIGKEMKLAPQTTIATACVYFHRFYMFHSMIEYPPRASFGEFLPYFVVFQIAVLGCLFLAGKVEETPKKCKDLLSAAQAKHSAIYARDTISDITNFEKVLLHTLRFDLQVVHPYSFLIDYMKVFQFDNNEKSGIASCAWTFINDSFATTLCLMFEPEILAVALIQMAINMALDKKTITEVKYKDQDVHKSWWNHFVEGLYPNTIEVINHILKKFYDESGAEIN